MKKYIIILFFVSGFIKHRAHACTIFSCARNGETFASANEDDYTPFTRIWFNPRTKERAAIAIKSVQPFHHTYLSGCLK